MSETVLEILGSGGASSIPQPLCQCAVCIQARRKGYPYKRTGPSVFLHGPDLLFDTPEESADQMNRAGIKAIQGCFYSHWHPDHTAGSRVWECHRDPRVPHEQRKKVDIYLPRRVAEDFRQFHGLAERFDWLERCQVIRQHIVEDNQPVAFGDVTVVPFRLAEEIAYGFDIRISGKRVLLLVDEVFKWEPDDSYRNADLVLLQTGMMEFNPLTGERILAADHPILTREPDYPTTVRLADKLQAKQTVFCHINEFFGLSYDDYILLEKQFAQQGRNFVFAYDGMRIAL